MDEFNHELINVNALTIHVVSDGPIDAPPVVMCHGFPETWYSWRHQLSALGAAGYRAIAFDWRGYGESSCPREVSDYGSDRLTEDLCGLLDHYGYEQATFLGHDWGALALWEMARLHPSRVRALFNMSVPLATPHRAPLEMYDAVFAEQFFYINYFQPVGVAEAELEGDTRHFLRDFYYSASGDGMKSGKAFTPAPREGTTLLSTLAEAPGVFPSWLSEKDIDTFAAAFATSGFFGPLSFYRNIDANWRRSKDIALSTLTMPIAFLTGSLDPVRFMMAGVAEAMGDLLPDFRGVIEIDDVGHWIQQERPEETTRAVLRFLDATK